MDARTALRWQLADEEPRLPGLVERVQHPEFAGVTFLHVRAKSLINRVRGAGNLPFEYTVNVYRGCTHACTYCFARPSHTYLDLDPWQGFERDLVVKINAVERLRADLARPSWRGEHVAMGTNTDPYQRAEGRYRLTRGVLEVLAEARNPFSVLTKSALVTRDLDVLTTAATGTDIAVNLSVGTVDPEVWRLTEPGTPHPRARLEAVAALGDAGIPAGVMLAPVLPGLSDSAEQLDATVAAAVEAGATFVSPIVLHLRPGVRELYLAWLDEVRPDLRPTYERLYRGSYAPRAYRQRVAGLVRRALRRHGGPVSDREPRGARRPAEKGEAAAGPDAAGSPQLQLPV